MNLQTLSQMINQKEVSQEMYNNALAILDEPMQENYTLQEYTALLYIIGAYQEVKGLSVYCGLRIEQALNKKMFKITKNDLSLNEYVNDFRLETNQKVDQVMKLIDRRFFNINLVILVVVLAVLIFLLQQNLILSISVGLISFALNYFVSLPRMKKKYMDAQMIELQSQLFESFKKFEEEIY